MWTTTWTPTPQPSLPQLRRLGGARRRLVTGLLRLSAALLHVAVRLQQRPRPRLSPDVLEYHAEAGAPEGALYADGRLVGWLDGVPRL